MALGTREDEVSVMTVLDALAQRSLHRFLRITGNGLEFINGYQARLICLGKIGKDLIQRNIRRLNISDAHAPFRISVDIERNGRFQRLKHIQEELPHLSALRFQCSKNPLAQSINKLPEIFGIVHINIYAMILLPDFLLIETMINQPRLSQSSWCYQCHIASVG